jgi:RimJ/RimL family protein N-acetyltransferase
MADLNLYQQPIGEPLSRWVARARPPHSPIEGRYCRLEPLDAQRHAAELHIAYGKAADDRDWTYMLFGPFADTASYREYIEHVTAQADPLHYAVLERKTGSAVGTLALMRIDQANGVIEVGHVIFSPLLKRTPLSTEAQYLLMKHVFDDLGYRRYEWKCDSLNAPSRQAAKRLGFRFEGVFLQSGVYRGRTRDTAWFSIIDREWPALRAAFERWLAPENFDAQGLQRTSLTQIRSLVTQPAKTSRPASRPDIRPG